MLPDALSAVRTLRAAPMLISVLAKAMSGPTEGAESDTPLPVLTWMLGRAARQLLLDCTAGATQQDVINLVLPVYGFDERCMQRCSDCHACCKQHAKYGVQDNWQNDNQGSKCWYDCGSTASWSTLLGPYYSMCSVCQQQRKALQICCNDKSRVSVLATHLRVHEDFFRPSLGQVWEGLAIISIAAHCIRLACATQSSCCISQFNIPRVRWHWLLT